MRLTYLHDGISKGGFRPSQPGGSARCESSPKKYDALIRTEQRPYNFIFLCHPPALVDAVTSPTGNVFTPQTQLPKGGCVACVPTGCNWVDATELDEARMSTKTSSPVNRWTSARLLFAYLWHCTVAPCSFVWRHLNFFFFFFNFGQRAAVLWHWTNSIPFHTLTHKHRGEAGGVGGVMRGSPEENVGVCLITAGQGHTV